MQLFQELSEIKLELLSFRFCCSSSTYKMRFIFNPFNLEYDWFSVRDYVYVCLEYIMLLVFMECRTVMFEYLFCWVILYHAYYKKTRRRFQVNLNITCHLWRQPKKLTQGAFWVSNIVPRKCQTKLAHPLLNDNSIESENGRNFAGFNVFIDPPPIRTKKKKFYVILLFFNQVGFGGGVGVSVW